MEKQNRENDVIDATLSSLEGMERAPMDKRLSASIVDSMMYPVRTVRSLKPVYKWAVAASIVILTGINVLCVIRCERENRMAQNPVYQEYFSYFHSF